MPGKLKHNLTGRKFGMLTVVSIAFRADKKVKYVRWNCQCDCGKQTIKATHSLLVGDAKTCGCKPAARTHGMRHIPEYAIWQAMVRRCENPNASRFERYGGRGISVCERWKSFENFFRDMGQRPSAKHQIDRIDNDGNYEPENCRWTTCQTNSRNRRNNRLLTFNGQTKCISEWADCAESNGISRTAFALRIRRGWLIERALTEPMKIAV